MLLKIRNITSKLQGYYQWFKPKYRLDQKITLRSYIHALVITAVSGIVIAILERSTEEPFSNLSVVFLIPVLYNTIQYGVRCALVSSVFALFIFDFFFLPPFFNALDYSPDNLVKFLTFVVAILITHVLAGEVRNRGISLEKDKRNISLLLTMSEKLASLYEKDAVIHASEKIISDAMGVQASIAPQELPLAENTLRFAIKSGKHEYGALVLGKPQVLSDQGDFTALSELIAFHLATHIERAVLHQEKETALLQVERESIRNALLTSLSHDLKTPLAGIIGAVTTLNLSKTDLTKEQEHTLIKTIYTESERLNGFVTNLLNVTRLESGTIRPNARWTDLDDTLDRATKQLHEKLQHYRMKTDIEDDLASVFIDPLLMEQVLINILENACKYSSEGSTIRIHAYSSGESLFLDIEDEGIGIPENDLDRIFDKFSRLEHKDKQIAGTGLGLFISRGIFQLLGGEIFALIPEKKTGALIRIAFPSDLLKTEAALSEEETVPV